MSDNILDNADDKTQQKLISNADNLREVPTSDNGITSTLLEEKMKDGTIKNLNNKQFIASDHIVSDFIINNSTIGDIMEKDVATSIGSNDANAIDSSNLIDNDHHISQNIDFEHQLSVNTTEASLADNVGREDTISDTNLTMDINNIDTTNVIINNTIDENNKNDTIDATVNVDNINNNFDNNTSNNKLPYNLRIRKNKFDVKSGQFKALLTKIEQQVNELGEPGMSAMKAELKQLLDKHVFDPVYKGQIPYINGKQNILPNQSLIKVKRDNIVKARSVGGGHRQDKSIYDILKELSSATIKSESIMLILTLALMNNDKILSADIVGAYLNAFMERAVYMKFNKFETKLLCELNNNLIKFVNKEDGCMYVKLIKALYGCVES
jgi:hypothetical protein